MTVELFREKTAKLFHAIGNMSLEDVESISREHISSVLEEYEVKAEIVECVLTGSRARGIEKSDSDLDIVVELKTDEREDYLFNLLNSEEWYLNGVKVDINPITVNQTGSMEDYLDVVDKYLNERMMKVNGESCNKKCFSHRR